MEIPIQAQPSLPCKCHASCVLSCPLLPPSWTSLAPLAFTFSCCKLAVGCHVPSRGAGTQLSPQTCGTRHMEAVVPRGQEHHVPNSTHPLPLCLLCGWCRTLLDIKALLGTLKHVLLSFPLDPLAQVHTVLSCGGGCIAQLVLTLGVSSTRQSSAALSPKGTRAERSDGPSSAARLSPGGEQEAVSARG